MKPLAMPRMKMARNLIRSGSTGGSCPWHACASWLHGNGHLLPPFSMALDIRALVFTGKPGPIVDETPALNMYLAT